MNPISTVLAVDDEPKALALLRNIAEPDGHRVITAPSGAAALELATRERPDVVLLDVMMPEMDGFEVCRRLRANPELDTLPILLLTALDDRESRLQGLEAGADDFITKPFDPVELRIRLRTLRRLNRYRRLYEESSRFEAIVTHSNEGIVLVERDGTIVLRNAAFDELLLASHRTMPNINNYLAPADATRLRAAIERVHAHAPAPSAEFTLEHGRSEPTVVEISIGLVPWAGRAIVQLHVRDLTEKKTLEAQLLRSQRIELLGQLSGSVVHDMNNVLAAIGGSATLLDLDPQGANAANHRKNIQTAVNRGASMLRQLLHFARGADGPLEAQDLRATVFEVTELVRQSFGAWYEVSLDAAPDLPAVPADATQVHQIVMNLCVNARDAMPDGGKLHVSLTRRSVTPEIATAAGQDARAGDYVVVSVRDNGTGIPPAVQARLFDPFFTTKPQGKGTGLGLATVLRLVRRHGGFVSLETQVGVGTCFHCHFPLSPAAATA